MQRGSGLGTRGEGQWLSLLAPGQCVFRTALLGSLLGDDVKWKRHTGQVELESQPLAVISPVTVH